MTKKQKLFVVLSALFVANALIAEFIGVKIFSLEKSFGMEPLHFSIFGNDMSLSYTAGVIIWPMVFIITDIVNEYYGEEGVRFISFLGAGIIAYAFIAIYIAIHTAPADWWVGVNTEKGVPDMNNAYSCIFGQGLNIIYGSLVAFVLGQLVDVKVFQKLKSISGGKYLWLRATGSTLISQAIDSFVVIFLAFYIGAGWKWDLVMAVALNNYIYKFLIAICITPVLYGVHHIIDRYLNEEKVKFRG
jgi:queuosine precursor transporter